MTKRRLLISIAIVVALAIFVGCVQTIAKSGDETAMGTKDVVITAEGWWEKIIGCVPFIGKPEEMKITIGYQPTTHQVAEMMAMEKGWWNKDLKKFGVKVDDKVFPSGPPEMQAMLGGDIDVAYVGVAPPITAIGQGLDAKIVAAVNTQGSALVLRPEITYDGPLSLKGLKIATFPPGSVQDTILKKWLEENGINPDKDLDIIPMETGSAITAIESGRIDGVFLPSPSPSKIVLDGKGKIVIESGEMWPGHACCVLLVSGKLIREHPEIVEEIVKTHMRATNYIYENEDDSIKICSDKTGISEDTIRYSVRVWDGRWVVDPHPIIDSALEYARVQRDLGYIKKELRRDEIFDLKFYDDVIEQAKLVPCCPQ